MIKQIKVQKNIENAYGFKSSEFIRIVRWPIHKQPILLCVFAGEN
jgi:hypothetical protein